jgi:hypothetical protein
MRSQDVQPKPGGPPQNMSENYATLEHIFNWLCVSAIDRVAVLAMAERLGHSLASEDISIDVRWKINYDQYQIFDSKHQQLYHIKRAWEANYLREVLALHLATRVFDPELVVPDYLTGTYAGKKTTAPYILTTFVKGKMIKFSFKKDPGNPLWSLLGRQYYLHVLLSLYDVDPRHFLVVDEGKEVKRLDLGLAFTKLNQVYDGFQAVFKGVAFEENPAFQQGVAFEREKVLHNLQTTRPILISILSEFNQLEEDAIVDFNPSQFVYELMTYWAKVVPELDIGRAPK